jgi:hypothetical protein
MQVTVYIYNGRLAGLRIFRSVKAAQSFINRTMRRNSKMYAFIHEIKGA